MTFKTEGTCTGRFKSEEHVDIELDRKKRFFDFSSKAKLPPLPFPRMELIGIDFAQLEMRISASYKGIMPPKRRLCEEGQIAIDIETNPYMCIDCGASTWDSGIRLPDGSTLCHVCKEKREENKSLGS